MQQTDPHEQLHIIEDYCFEEGRVSKYMKGNFLGKGGFARCYEVFSEDNQNALAVKIIQKSTLVKQRSKQKLMSEIKIHRTLKHPNIVKFQHQFEDNLNVYILLELCPNKTLNDLLKRKRRLTQTEVRYYLMHLLEGLDYLHSQKVIHRDLKLGNLFLNEEMQLKIGDFGLATRLDFMGQKRKTICGTPNYIAPEILESKGHSYQVDIWSFGVIVYTLTYGRPPFESKDVKETYKKIKMGIFTFPDNVQTSSCLKFLVTSTLQKDPAKRPTIKELKNFQFFRGPNLTRQPSMCLKNQPSTISINRDQRQLSDNGKIYTNNELLTSKDTARQKSQDKFLVTERNNSSASRNNKQSTSIRRSGSQRILKETNPLRNIEIPILKPTKGDIVEVKKWIDYSSKYGIGYVMSNGHFGVYFNDSTKLVACNQQRFHYLERVDRQDMSKVYSFKDYPVELKKKVSLFNHFKGYLSCEPQNNFKLSSYDEKNFVYVRRWFRSKHAVIFRLSNKSVQVIFIDQSELLISAATRQVNYINKLKQKQAYSLSDIMQSENRELIKRFQYTKEVLNQMANTHQNKKK